jgi:hypothetical protein
LAANAKLLEVCEECAFADLSDVAAELRAERGKLKRLSRLVGQLAL